MNENTIKFLCLLLCVFSVQLKAQNYLHNLRDHFGELISNEKLLHNDIQWKVVSEHVSSTSNVTHIYFMQIKNGIQIMGTNSSIHILPDGESIVTNNNFIKNSDIKIKRGNNNLITAKQAVIYAANQLNYIIDEPITVISKSNDTEKRTLLSDGGISLRDIPAKLIYQLNDRNELILAWDISILETNERNWWSLRVDGNTGIIINKNNWIDDCLIEGNINQEDILNYNVDLNNKATSNEISKNLYGDCENCYEVLALPLESPYL